MDLITTHINADFDALGSIVAAKKLYPDSRLLLPGSQEEAVREFLSLAKELIIVESERECKLDDVRRLILVDTRQKSRIGIASELVDKGVEVHIYDHHPRMKGDIVADKDVFEEVGATVSILSEIIKKKRIKLSPLEATIMLLGIYEETGSLTYRSTTKLDVDMISFLLSQGASLSIVSRYLNRELSEAELSLLTRLISSTKKILIKGFNVSVIEIESGDYVGELGMIIHKLMEIENIPVLFVFIDTLHGRTDIVARSKVPSIDVNKVLSHFGGGGHPGAASAKVRGEDVDSLKEKLIKVLKSYIKVKLYARDIMSHDLKVMNINKKIEEAKRILSKEKVGGMPVVDRGRLAGIITLDGLNKAIKRGFSHSRIKGYMSRDVVTVKPTMPLYTIQKMMLDKGIGVLPVLKGRKMIGIIHRTDVLKNVHDSLFLGARAVKKNVISNLSNKMASLLPKDVIQLLKKIGTTSNSIGFSAFVVGGLVRDLILGAKNLDLDIVVEGDAIKLGQALAEDLGASIVIHKRFGTCSVVNKKGLKIDLATARKEVYERPAALPTVEFSSLKNDLIRRDFTINAMAVSLNKASFGQLIDFFGGEEDLSRGIIKVMHDGSFIDDPTRIFRAVRFEQRFGFSIDGHTEGLIKNAIEKEMFDKVEPQRIRDEVILILKEKEPFKALKRMAELDELRFLHQKIKFNKDLTALYKSIDEACLWYDTSGFKKRPIDKWLVYLIALFERLTYNEVLRLCEKFVFRRGDVLRILSYKKNAKKIIRTFSVPLPVLPSSIYVALEPLSFEVALLIMANAKAKLAKVRIKDFFRKFNGIKISVRGDDIRAMGLKPCPDFKIILKKVLYEKINGKLKTRKDELAYAGNLVKRVCG